MLEALSEKCRPLHSILKIRLGATPLTEVKIPLPAPVRIKSSQNGKSELFSNVVGRHALLNMLLLLLN